MGVSLYFKGDNRNQEEDPSPSMNYRNARDWFSFVGVEMNNEGYGSMAVSEMIERCSEKLAVLAAFPYADEGIATTYGTGEGGCTWIDCGRSDDYMQIRTQDILRYAREAEAAGATEITWG